MSNWISDQIILKMIKNNIDIRNSNILILGFRSVFERKL